MEKDQFGRPEAGEPDAPFTLPPEAIEALKRGNPIEAIKIIRKVTGAGLAEAKGLVDHIQKGMKGARPSAPMHVAHPHIPRPGLGPGEVPRGGGSGKWFALIAGGLIAVLAALYYR